MEPATEAPQELVAALAAHGEALAAELRALDDMPQVKLTPASVFDRAKPPGARSPSSVASSASCTAAAVSSTRSATT